VVRLENILSSVDVAVSAGHDGYPSVPPYSPGSLYPEYPFGPDTLSKEANHAYEGVRDSLRLLKLDAKHYGQEDWSPLGHVISPGNTVVLKPNLVRHFRDTHDGDDDCLITHGSVIRAVLDYVYIALKGRGRIVIADAPHNDADFETIRQMTRLDEIQSFYREKADFDVEIYDLRPEQAIKIDGVITGHEALPGDPAGFVKVRLDEHSMFNEVSDLNHLLYGSEYDTSELQSHHHDGIHEYLICKTILDADCIINLPKLKTHKKTGLTVCLKNLVGINGNKNWLPHHRLGTPAQGGDQFCDEGFKHNLEQKTMAGFRKIFPFLGPLRKLLAKPLKAMGAWYFGETTKDTIRSGNWYGNDTTWRMALDLNRILLYADSNGQVQSRPARRLFCVVDGIVGGEGNGPLDPRSKPSGSIIAGMNPVATEMVCARLMDFDYLKMPVLYRSLDAEHPLPLVNFGYEDIRCASNQEQLNNGLREIKGELFGFEPHFGWKGHVELARKDGDTKKKLVTTNCTN